MSRFMVRWSFFSACADKVIEFHLILHFTFKFGLKIREAIHFGDVIYRRLPAETHIVFLIPKKMFMNKFPY